jgi:hypothetical protein
VFCLFERQKTREESQSENTLLEFERCISHNQQSAGSNLVKYGQLFGRVCCTGSRYITVDLRERLSPGQWWSREKSDRYSFTNNTRYTTLKKKQSVEVQLCLVHAS